MRPQMRALLCLLVLALAALAAVVPSLSASADHVGREGEVQRFDLSIESVPYELTSGARAIPGWTITVRNNIIDGHLGVDVRDIKIKITPLRNPSHRRLVTDGEEFVERFDEDTGILTLRPIAAGGSAVVSFLAGGHANYPFPPVVPTGDVEYHHQRHLHAQLISSEPEELEAYKGNNETEAWHLAFGQSSIPHLSVPIGDAGVEVGVHPRFPTSGDQVTFELGAVGVSHNLGVTFSQHADTTSAQLNVGVRIELSDGLEFAGGLDPPELTAESGGTRYWKVGRIDSTSHTWQRRSIPVVLSASPSLDELPLEQRCLTASIDHDSLIPRYDLDPMRRANDVAKVCLGEHPPVVVSEGVIVLWRPHDCVGNDDVFPCDDGDDLKLLARVNHDDIDDDDFSLAGIHRRYDTVENVTYIDPNAVIVQVKDPSGRRYDSSSHSLTNATTVSWQTGWADRGDSYGTHPGALIWYSRAGFNDNIADWSNLVRTLSVSGLNGAAPPGRLKVRHDSSTASTFYNPAPPSYSHARTPFSLNSPTTIRSDYFLEFSALGTYEVTFHALANRTSGSPPSYEADATTTFHVGPISELSVWDAGASPLAATGQTAFTIAAANNGPDTAPMVQVALTGVPPGSQVILSEGEYVDAPCTAPLGGDACWILGRMPLSTTRPHGGEPDFPTLTLIVPDGAPTQHIQAAIANTEDYSVTIDGTVHSTPYFDHIEENNTATIEALPGTGAGAPGQPQGVGLRQYPHPRVALVSWDRVERLNSLNVNHYEVHQSAPPCQRPLLDPPSDEISIVRGNIYLDTTLRVGEEKCYAVRAVNTLGVKGYWSNSVGTLRGLNLSVPSVTVSEAGGEASYTVVLSSQPSGQVTVRLANDNPDAVALDPPNTLTFDAEDWHIPKTVKVTGRDDSRDNPSNRRTATIRHTARGGGFDDVAVATLQVSVTDDDGEAGVTVSRNRVTIAENGGEGRYTLVLNTEPTGFVEVILSSTDELAATVTPTRLIFTPENWSDAQELIVTGVPDEVDNKDDRRAATIEHTISGGGYDDVPVPDVTVTVVDDDGPPPQVGDPGVTVSDTSLTVPEGGAGYYTITLNSAPTGDVRVDLSSDDTGLVAVEPDYLLFTTNNWDDSPRTVTVIGVDDDFDNTEVRRTFIRHTVSGGGYGAVVIEPVEVALTDDDGAGITVSVGTITLEENGGTVQYTVRLDTEPAEDVIVNVVSVDPNVATVDRRSLHFNRNDWYVPHVVTVTAQNDGFDNKPPGFDYTDYVSGEAGSEDRRMTTIIHTASTGSEDPGGYHGLDKTIDVRVNDDDEPGARVGECLNADCSEKRWLDGDNMEITHPYVKGHPNSPDGQTKKICIELGSQPKSEIKVHIQSSNKSSISVLGSTVRFINEKNWNRCRIGQFGGMGSDGQLWFKGEAGDVATITITILKRDGGDGDYYLGGKVLAEFTARITE